MTFIIVNYYILNELRQTSFSYICLLVKAQYLFDLIRPNPMKDLII